MDVSVRKITLLNPVIVIIVGVKQFPCFIKTKNRKLRFLSKPPAVIILPALPLQALKPHLPVEPLSSDYEAIVRSQTKRQTHHQ